MQGLTVTALPDAPEPTSFKAEASFESSTGYENDSVIFPASNSSHQQSMREQVDAS
jgi:hypothetical protein